MPERKSAIDRWTAKVQSLENKLSHPHLKQTVRKITIDDLEAAAKKLCAAIKRLPKLK